MRPLKSILLHKNVDCETPVSLYQKVRGQGPSFLLESVEGQENWARYSFIGLNPLALFSSTGNSVSETIRGKRIRKKVKDPFKAFEKFFYSFQYDSTEVPARFLGGAVGYLSYDMVRYFEKLPKKGKDDLKVPDSCFMIPQILLIFDNVRHTLEMVGFSTGKDEKEVRKKLEEISRGIDVVGAALRGRPQKGQPHRVAPTQLTPNWSPERFKKAVRQVKEYISAGDVTQTVLSIRFQRSFKEDPFEVYRSLRRLNPSPYMFYLDCEDLVLVGSSPETMVRLEEGQMTLRPIAGTRPRGASKAEDDRLAKELLADPKERAEHTMLVDLGRNDLGRVAAGGTVHVDELMTVEKYSHVQHIVSNVRARLASGKNGFDLVRAAFPAGTLSGSPKIRAMEIIEGLEPTRRGTYGGCVGYISFSGNLDMAITIRSALIKDGKISIQAGAGIVADSDPEKEYEECLNKAKGVFNALNDR